MLATSSNSAKAAKILIKSAGQALAMQTANTACKGQGMTCLHFAVANNMPETVREILDCLNTEEQVGLIHRHTNISKCRGELCPSSLVLNLSCWIGSVEIFNELLDRGADLDKVDSRGCNAIHMLVEVSVKRPEDAIDMLGQVFGSDATRRWFCRKQDIDQKYWTPQDDEDVKRLLLNMKNDDGYTPLTLAARLRATEILDYIINCEGVYRNTIGQFGLNYSVRYDVTEINSFSQGILQVETPSVMNFLVFRRIGIESVKAFSIPVIKELVSIRWRWYRICYLFWAFVHFLTMISCFYIPITYLTGKDAFFRTGPTKRMLPTNATLLPLSKGLLDFNHMDASTLVPFKISLYMVIATLIGCGGPELLDSFLGAVRLILYATRKWHCKYYKAPFMVMVKWDFFRVVMVVFIISEIITLYELFVNARIAYGASALSLISGWYFLLFFLRGFRSTGYFGLIMHRILVTDMLSFMLVVLVMLFAFSSSLMFVVTVGDSETGSCEGFETIFNSLYTVYKMTIGYAHEPEVNDGHQQTVITLIFVLFVTLCCMLLLNMLIAAMSNSYSELAGYQEQLWTRSRAAAMLLLERQFFWFLSKFMNKRCLEYDEDSNRWYFQIETTVPPS